MVAAGPLSPSWPGAVVDDADMSVLRRQALALGDGTDWWRCDDHQVIERLLTARAPVPQGATPALLRLVAVAPVAPPPPAPAAAASPRPSGAPTPAVAAEGTFDPALDVAAMVAVLVQAARDGTPFCEECARAAAATAA